MMYLRRFARLATFFSGAIALYFLTRLYHILSLPIFTDEAIYTRWSQIASLDANWRFISLTDGKQPLFVWLSMIIIRFVQDPLLAGRLVSVGAGLITLIGLFLIGETLFRSKKIGFIASFLYILSPFALVYDKLSLYDSLVGALSIWSLYFEILLIRKKRLDIALILGMVLGLGVLTKSSGFFSIYLLPVSLLLFNWRGSNKASKFIKWVGLAVVAAVFAYVYYSLLRLSPFFHIINEKNATFVIPFSEWIRDPFFNFTSNMRGLLDWLMRYLTIPVVLLAALSFLIGKKSYICEKIFLFSWFFLPFTALGIFGRTLYPRFIFFMILPLLVLGAYSLHFIMEKARSQLLKIAIVLVFISSMMWADFFIFTDFAHAPIPRSDLEQLIRGWPAGGGIRESVAFFTEQSRNQKIFVGTEGTFGLMPYSYEIYLKDNKNIKIVGYWPIKDAIPQELLESAKKMPTYVVFYQPCAQCKALGGAPASWPLRQVLTVRKGIGESSLSVYQVIPY